MKLKKMLPELAQAIQEDGFDTEPKAIQTLTLPKIKSGADFIAVAPPNSGKSTAICIGVIQQLKAAFEEAPRAIILVNTKDDAFALDEKFESLARHTNLRTLFVYDQGQLKYQKDMIYSGIDVLIATPKRLTELLNNTGVPLSNLKMLVVDDGENMLKGQNNTIIHRICDSMKVQVMVFAGSNISKFDDLAERSMKNPYRIETE